MIKDPDSKVTQAAFADDLAGALQQLQTWWNNIVEYGPLLGYNPQAEKSWLVVKEHLLEETRRVIFAASNVNITVEGHEYLGGFVGSIDGQIKYARKKVDNFIGSTWFVCWPTLRRLNRKLHMLLLSLVSADALITLSEQHLT